MESASESSGEQMHYQYDQNTLPPNIPQPVLAPSTNFPHPYNSQPSYHLHQQPIYTDLAPRSNGIIGNDAIEKKLDEIRENQSTILNSLQKIEARLIAVEKTNNPDIDDFELPDRFPLTSIEEFEEFERDTNKSRVKALRDYLKFIGGQNLREALHNFLRVAFTEELSEQFTWTGRSAANAPLKKKFKGTKIMKAFMSAAKRIKKIQNFTFDEFTTNFNEVLRSYKQISRSAKKKRANQGHNEDENYLLSDDEDMS